MAIPGRCIGIPGTYSRGKWFWACFLPFILALFLKLNSSKSVILVVDGKESAVVTKAATVGEFLGDQGLFVRSRDVLRPDAQTRIQRGMKIYLNRALPVFLHLEGQTRLVYTTAGEVSQLLAENTIALGPLDRVEPDFKSPILPGSTVRVTRVTMSLIQEEGTIPFNTVKKYDQDTPAGRNKVVVQGRYGLVRKTFEVLFADGLEESRTLVLEETLQNPVDSVVLVGTGEALPAVSSRGGEVLPGLVVEGMASWYGADFHGRKTHYGEVFDKNAYTAAHRTLPYNTRLLVTFLKTGCSVEVRVNDYGPHISGRIIDLSMAAAEAIGLRSAGTGMVRIEVLP